MEAFFSWVGAALGALFVIAVAVAWWEHLVYTDRPAAPPPAATRAVSVDVSLDSLIDAAPPTPAVPAAPAAPAVTKSTPPSGDAAERRATLNGAMSRMAARPAGFAPSAWPETSPMVLHPPADEPAAAPSPSSTRA